MLLKLFCLINVQISSRLFGGRHDGKDALFVNEENPNEMTEENLCKPNAWGLGRLVFSSLNSKSSCSWVMLAFIFSVAARE